jgi:hypothetical protein
VYPYSKEKIKIPLLGKAIPSPWWRIPILSGLLLEVNCLLHTLLFPHLPHPLPAIMTFTYIQTTLTCPLFLSGTNMHITILVHNYIKCRMKNYEARQSSRILDVFTSARLAEKTFLTVQAHRKENFRCAYKNGLLTNA